MRLGCESLHLSKVNFHPSALIDPTSAKKEQIRLILAKFGSKLVGLPSAGPGDEHKNLDSRVYPIEKDSAVRCQEWETNFPKS